MERSIRNIICLVVLLTMTGCGSKVETGELEAPACLVRITAGNVNGSGILYSMNDDFLYVMTAAHMAEHAPEAGGVLTLMLCDGWEITSSDFVICEFADLALVRIPVKDILPEHLERYQCVQTDKESFDQLRAEDYCEAVGYVGTAEMVRSEGSILEPWIYMEDYSQYMIWADAEIQPGMSGGGLLDSDDRLIGILSGGSEDDELAAVPLSLILQFLISIGSENF